jgi:hypothetical protein
LIDEAINHFFEWFLIGVQETGHWGYGLEDVTNQYVLEGVRGGILSLALFISIIVISFRDVGFLWRSARSKSLTMLAWALGVCLFIHCMNFLAVSYFGQITVIWYMLLAMIASLSSTAAELTPQFSRSVHGNERPRWRVPLRKRVAAKTV